ncbi:hypothetical protein BGX26_010827 [Mortierella sp. AD094]|nr:hypothetical protein BGX26_010827 [Mortierella sp. AD094]
MNNIRWYHPQLPIPLRFSISLEQWYLENQLSSNSATEHTMTLSLPVGFCLSVTQLQPQCFDCNTTSTSRNAAEFSSVDGLVPQVVELYLSLLHLTHSALFADIIRDVKAAHFAEICEDGFDLPFNATTTVHLDADDVLSPWCRTFEIILTCEPLHLLVSKSSLDLEKAQTRKQPFGRMLLVNFLHDVVRSTDISYVATRSPEAGLHAHRAIMQQWPVFANLMQKQTRLWDEPTVQVLLDIDPNVMRLIINFIYLGQIEGPGYAGIVDWRQIYQLSHRFQVNRLSGLALEEMCKGMLPQNVLPTLFQWGYQHPDFDKRLLELAFANREKLLAPSIDAALKVYRGHSQHDRIYSRLCELACNEEYVGLAPPN